MRIKPLESPEEANVKIPLRELPQLLAYKRKNSDEDIITIISIAIINCIEVKYHENESGEKHTQKKRELESHELRISEKRDQKVLKNIF